MKVSKEELRALVDEGIKESYPLWSDFMSRENFENLEPLLGLTVLTVLMKIKGMRVPDMTKLATSMQTRSS